MNAGQLLLDKSRISDRTLVRHSRCSAQCSSKPHGFTLVEILIVVIILGILAAIVIPQFTSASQNARVSGTLSTLQTLRNQIQLYKIQHGDTLPNLITDWTPLTQGSTYGSNTYVPYMLATPNNSLNGLSAVSDASGNLNGVTSTAALTGLMKTATNVGFLYDYESGNGSGLIFVTDATGAAIAGNGTAY